MEGTAFAPHRLFAGRLEDLLSLVEESLHLQRLHGPEATVQVLEDFPLKEEPELEEALSFEALRRVARRVHPRTRFVIGQPVLGRGGTAQQVNSSTL